MHVPSHVVTEPVSVLACAANPASITNPAISVARISYPANIIVDTPLLGLFSPSDQDNAAKARGKCV